MDLSAPPPGNPTGRPTKLTPAVQKRLLDAIRTGHFLTHAAALAGVRRSTVHEWLQRGEADPVDAGDEVFEDFALLYRQAEAEAVDAALLAVQLGEPGWKARAWWLERRAFEQYASRKVLTHTGPDGGPLQLAVGPTIFTPKPDDPE